MELDLVARVVLLSRTLRSRGFLAGTGHSIDAVRAVREVPIGDRALFYLALRTVLVSRPEERAPFDQAFTEVFSLPGEGPLRSPEPPAQNPQQLSVASWLLQGDAEVEDGEEEIRGASVETSLAEQDFKTFDADQLEEIERIAARLSRRLASRRGRRWKPARRGARVDLRRTARKSLATGVPLELCRRDRKPRKTRLVALCDVSGSMDLYSRFLLQFLYALQGSVARVESFVFATELSRVTEVLRLRPWAHALRGLPGRGFSGGTRIGGCLERFRDEFSSMLDHRTVLVVLSDGWDTGEPAALSAVMEDLRGRCRHVVWLNPLLGSPGYEPTAAGMQAALPHVSVFAPAHNLSSLRALERHLLL